MLTRLAACFLSFGLLGNVVAAPEAEAPAITMRAAPEKAAVRKALEKRRAKNLAAFRSYRKGGVYPHNTWRFGPLNVWIDKQGHLCAAATMIDKDGKHELVVETGRTNNQIRLMNVTEGALLDWIMMSGFTIEEIDRIQMPMIGDEGRLPDEMRDWSAEDARLRKAYAVTDAWLVKRAKAGLDLATERVLQNPELAWRLVDGTL